MQFLKQLISIVFQINLKTGTDILSIFVQYLVYKHIKCFSKMKLRWDLDILQVQF